MDLSDMIRLRSIKIGKSYGSDIRYMRQNKLSKLSMQS